VQQAQQQIGQAQNQMNQGQQQAAQQSMQQAAQSLQQASQQLANAQKAQQPGKPSQPFIPGEKGATGGGLADLAKYGIDPKQLEGRSWGELDGKLQTKIVQALKAEFGEDYARRIKLYFEQIADTRRR
jgi:hypothetical protein